MQDRMDLARTAASMSVSEQHGAVSRSSKPEQPAAKPRAEQKQRPAQYVALQAEWKLRLDL